jgi:signal transduction histidine kinase
MSEIVLVVEDDAQLREEVALILADSGYTVYSAFDGQNALDILSKARWQPDLIVSDILMPRMDGYGLIQAIHDTAKLQDVPFIFLTAYGTRQDQNFGRELGVDDYLTKPFEPEAFIKAIRAKMKRIKAIKEAASKRFDESKKGLVQLVSHELRTPISYILGGVSLLVEELHEGEMVTADALSSLNLVQHGATRLARLVEQMIMYTDLVSGYVRLQIAHSAMPLGITLLVSQVVDMHRADAESKNIGLYLDAPPPDSLHIMGLAPQLTHAISELVRNAVHYSPEQTDILVHVSHEPGSAVIRVIDHGRGIPETDIHQVLEPLSQSERSLYEQQGIGMGLPIARMAVEAHGGQLSLDSTPGQGTTVTVRLPLC